MIQPKQSLPETPELSASWIGGRYRIEHPLAEGGMGAVYAATDVRTGKAVVLKRMRAASGKQALALFEREYRTLVGIQHPRIIKVFEYGVDTSGPYYTMELVKGRDLNELAPVPFVDACRYLRDIATCLALLHTRRLLHRDLSPRNVRVTPDGRCKLLDFGALTSFGTAEQVVGTPPCIPPEAVRGAPLDQRADLFAFGALAYYMLTGRHAFAVRRVQHLRKAWDVRPPPPSHFQPEIPKDIDTLVLRLLSLDALARPGTIAEVFERLNLFGSTEPLDETTVDALARSYLAHTEFVGRERELHALQQDVSGLERGRGGSVVIEGPAGVGRSRLLAELALHGKLAGVETVHVDASGHRRSHGAAIALLQSLIEASQAAAHSASMHGAMLAQLDPWLAEQLGVAASAPDSAITGEWKARVQDVLRDVVAAACHAQPLLLIVDNADDADSASLALLSALQRLATSHSLLLVCAARAQPGVEPAARDVLGSRASHVELHPLKPADTYALARSIFGDAPNLGRCAEWLHELTAGRPLHLMELVRRLYDERTLRYADGLWILPAERPPVDDLPDLEQLVQARLSVLSRGAYAVAEAVALHSGPVSRERLMALAAAESTDVYAVIDELVGADVVQDVVQGYRLSHRVLHDLLQQRLSPERRAALHRLQAEYLLGVDEPWAKIEGGWHLLHAGDEVAGADELAGAAYDNIGIRLAFADLDLAAPALVAALDVYTKQGRSLYERMPLLAALAQAGYYKDRSYAERYGEPALAAMEQLCGLRLARKLQPLIGKTAGLALALVVAYVRLRMALRRMPRRYGFRDLLVQLFGVVTTLTGAAAIALDVPRAERVARTLEPFAHLPERLTPVGIWQFCAALKEIGRDNAAVALATWSKLIERFRDPRYYPTLPERVRPLYLGGLWFARGVFEAFRDGGGALKAAEELDRLGIKLYQMIASELRVLHYANRGELDEARRHLEQVELHAIQTGSAWHVELWEPAALILVYSTIGDVVELRRVSERLASLSESTPSLALHAKLCALALDLKRVESPGLEMSESIHNDLLEGLDRQTMALCAEHPPRSFIGWGAVYGYFAAAMNRRGRYQAALNACEHALSHLTDDDRAFVALYLNLDIELAVAHAGLGDPARARAELDALMARHRESSNALTRGRLHEACARVAALVQDWQTCRHHASEAHNWFRSTRTPALIARAEALRLLAPGSDFPGSAPEDATGGSTLATLDRSADATTAIEPPAERIGQTDDTVSTSRSPPVRSGSRSRHLDQEGEEKGRGQEGGVSSEPLTGLGTVPGRDSWRTTS